ncbi:MAG: hypothetical protein DI613_16835 [Kocuria rhizophila]|nr:MAG: hypothetical protein DI613_16835 [Kocuria rhizophila]
MNFKVTEDWQATYADPIRLKTIVSKTNAGCVAIEDYTAAELTCQAGQSVRGEKETHGWVFCRLQDGSAGWIPRRNLEANGG